jgi:hypothetical protein
MVCQKRFVLCNLTAIIITVQKMLLQCAETRLLVKNAVVVKTELVREIAGSVDRAYW